MDHQHQYLALQSAQQKLQELHQQAEIARALTSQRPRWLRNFARSLVRLARQMDAETVTLEAASR
ncbi:hypothetical protein [Deinococcus cellulosilyticus]|nr:hypothetical protein [Deinococcus cellulosilyticus]